MYQSPVRNFRVSVLCISIPFPLICTCLSYVYPSFCRDWHPISADDPESLQRNEEVHQATEVLINRLIPAMVS